MEFIVCDKELFARYHAEVGKIYFIASSIFPGLTARPCAGVEFKITPTDGGCYLAVLRAGENQHIMIKVPVQISCIFSFFNKEKGKCELLYSVSIHNKLPSGATLEGFLKSEHGSIPFYLKKGDKICNVCIMRREYDIITAVVLDFSAILVSSERAQKHYLEGHYHKCIEAPNCKDLDAKKKIGQYLTYDGKPCASYPCSVQIEEEEYGTTGAKKLNCRVSLGRHSPIQEKKVPVLVRLPSAKKHFTSAKHVRGYDEHFYSVYEVTFGSGIIEEFSLTLVEL